MAVSSFCLFPSLISPRRYTSINPTRSNISTSTKFNVKGGSTGDLSESTIRVSQIFSTAAHLTVEEKPPSSSRIFVKGLSRSTTEGYLSKQFSQFGEISRVKIVTSRGSKESLGMAYIWFSCKESAELAIEEMNGKVYLGDDFSARSTDEPYKVYAIQVLINDAAPT